MNVKRTHVGTEERVTQWMTSSLTDVTVLLASKEYTVKIQVNVIRTHVKISENVQYFRVDMNVVVREDFEEQDARFETNVTPAHVETGEAVRQLHINMPVAVSMVLLGETVKWNRNVFL